ncbi:MAG TPA: PAS domain S-box protein [Terriglobales bacterium]|nr:PAS domain S-box protein [Terriglobales bacterium]
MMIGQQNDAASPPSARLDSFQRLLLQLTRVASENDDFRYLIDLFCQSSREALGLGAIYFWQAVSSDVLVGAGGNGPEAAATRDRHLDPGHRPIVWQALRSRRVVSDASATPQPAPATVPGNPHSIAAPVLVGDQPQGVLLFVCSASTPQADPALIQQITILAALFGDSVVGELRARELQQLVGITAELSAIRKLDEFYQRLLVRAAGFLGFRRSAMVLLHNSQATVSWLAEANNVRPVRVALPEFFTKLWLSSTEPVSSEDVTREPLADLGVASQLKMKQYFALPLAGQDRRPMGFVLLLDKLAGNAIGPEDTRRATLLANAVAPLLEAVLRIDASQQNRKRAENLMALSLELNSSLRLPQFVRSFTERAADMLDARAGVLALAQRSILETVVLPENSSISDRNLVRRLNAALTELASRSAEPISSGNAAGLIGPALAGSLGWEELTVARLRSSDGDIIGMLCLIDRQEALAEPEKSLLTALAAHASVALENARLFTRMDQANRHWVEIFDAITDFIVVHDENNTVLRVNRTLADFIGVRPPELIGISMRALVAMASDHSTQPCPFCRVGLDGADEYIHPVLERTYLVSTSRIHGALNEGFQTIHVLKDITDRREAERRYRELFDTIQEGLFFSTPEGRFIEVNDALVRMLGYNSRDELLQIDIAPQLYASPAHREVFRREIEKTGTLRNYEELLRRKDGSLIHTLQNAFAVRDSQGATLQYRGLILDVTEQKNFQSELQRQRDFNNKILNATQSMILVVDTGGRISYANRRCFEAGGYRQEDLIGQRLTELVPPGRRESLAESLASTTRGQQVDNLELPIVLGRGRVGQFALNLSPMRDESGAVNSIVVVMTDITDAAMLQAKLMHTEKMAAVGQLVSGVAHEVNNPLTAILGFADLLLEHPNIPEFAKADLQVILQEGQRTKQIVQNLLSFARQMPPQRQPVRLNSILRQTLALRSYDFANHAVRVVEKFSEPLPDVIGDSHQLQQVFLNIVNNAYDAVLEAKRPGVIEIATSYGDGYAEVSFRDNGNGVLYPERIFDPFFTTKEVGKGTGLGLSICYGIIREHSGEIFCRNNADSPGATFIVRLPLPGDQETAPAAGAEAGAMQ